MLNINSKLSSRFNVLSLLLTTIVFNQRSRFLLRRNVHTNALESNTNAPAGLSSYHPTLFRVFKSILGLLSCLALFVTTVTTGQSALSAKTANTIHGTAPYLTFDGETKVTNTDELLGIKLSDGTSYTKLTNTSTASSPIELPVADQTFSDVKTLIPVTLTTVNLSTLISSPYNRWGDDDGDGLGAVGVSATGSLSLSLKDVNNNPVGLTDTLEGCKSPYTLTLTSTEGALSTQYGDPHSTSFTTTSTSYYIKPKFNAPYVCFARPNLMFNYGSQAEWISTKGFKLQDLGLPSSNFPRTGFHGAFFDLTVVGATVDDVMTATGPTISLGGVTVGLTSQSTNVVRVTLTGPNNASGGGSFTPSSFIIKSSATNEIYSFELSKWYVAKSGGAGGYSATQTYCSGLTGGYRVPSVSEYTNGNGSGWTGGLSGWSNNTYARAIGGGLFAEWGFAYNGYYSSSDFQYNRYWAVEQDSSRTYQYHVLSPFGGIAYADPSTIEYSAACVTP